MNAPVTPFEHELAGALYRATCPTPQDLGEFRLAILDEARVAEVETHLSRCPHCRTELEAFDALLELPLLPASEPDRIAGASSASTPRRRVLHLQVVDRLTGQAACLPFYLDLLRDLLAQAQPFALGRQQALVRGLRGTEGPTVTVTNEDGDDLTLGLVDRVATEGEPPRLHGVFSSADLDDGDLEVRLVQDDGEVLSSAGLEFGGFFLDLPDLSE